MQKRGQATIFIILGLLILIVSGVIYYTLSYIKETNIEKEALKKQLPSQIEPIGKFIDECLYSTSIAGTYLIAVKGGYYNTPISYIDTESIDIAYYSFKGKDVSPTLTQIENNLGEFIKEALPLCLQNFSKFESFKITPGALTPDVKINNENINIDIKYPIKIEKDNAYYEINTFSTIVPLRLGYLHSVAKEVVKREIKESGYVPITYLKRTGLDVSLTDYKEDILIYSLTDEESSINDIPFTLIFANKFQEEK
ncbi:MAG: hypothetical protein HYS32_02470 [Candidatus Woesearchaeota archaeon]|nr:MAG: hypothetical protein HYS32_02470 [Candidatus Woesearchaeota archaeon]